MERVSRGNSERKAGVAILLFLFVLSLATLHSGCAGVVGSSNSGAPTVSITSPTSGSSLSASITISTSTSANVVGVQFKLDGANLGSEKTSAPFSISWDTTTTANGQHTLTAVARNAGGQTGNSAPVATTVQNSAGSNPPVISGISASPGSISAYIIWNTDKPSDSQVDYGTTLSYGQTSALDSTLVTSHGLYIAGLAPSTTYHYRVKSKDAADPLATSGDNTFTTSSFSGGIPPDLGWYEIPNTKLASVCNDNNPATRATEGCSAVIADWSGGVAQTRTNRLIVWGGGHNGYYGNELYALDLNALNFIRLNNPSPTTNVLSCPEAYIDNTPSSRHTYGGIAYIPTRDSMFMYGGSKSACGFLATDTWIVNLSTFQWTRKDPTTIPANNPLNDPCVQSDYDPTTDTILLHDANLFYRYNPATNTYTILNNWSPLRCPTGAIDTGRRIFFFFDNGGLVYKIDYSGPGPTYTMEQITTIGCGPLTSAYVPGLAYDSRQQKIVGWAGGNTVYVFDPTTNQCTPVTYPGGPGSQQLNGTWGRFRYFPNLGLFALVNDWQQNAFTLRLTPAQ